VLYSELGGCWGVCVVLVVGGVVVPVVAQVGLLVAVLIVSVVIPLMVLAVVLVGVVDVVVPVGFPRGLPAVVAVVVVWEAGGDATDPIKGLPVGDVPVDGMPDNEVAVGSDPPAVDIDIVVELPAELRAKRQLVNSVRREWNIHLPGTAFRVTCVQVNDGSDVNSM
jgi:hypothetical protein